MLLNGRRMLVAVAISEIAITASEVTCRAHNYCLKDCIEGSVSVQLAVPVAPLYRYLMNVLIAMDSVLGAYPAE